MTQLAQRSGGAFHFIDDSAKVASVFREEIAKMERLVAKNTWVEVTPGPGVTIVDAIGQPRSVVGRSLRIQVGDVTEGQTRDFVVRVRATGKRDGGTVELLDAVVHHTLPEGGSELTASKFSSIKASADAAALKDAAVVVDRQATRLSPTASSVDRARAGRRRRRAAPSAPPSSRTTAPRSTTTPTFGPSRRRSTREEDHRDARSAPPSPGSASIRRRRYEATTAAKMASPAEAMEMRSMHELRCATCRAIARRVSRPAPTERLLQSRFGMHEGHIHEYAESLGMQRAQDSERRTLTIVTITFGMMVVGSSRGDGRWPSPTDPWRPRQGALGMSASPTTRTRAGKFSFPAPAGLRAGGYTPRSSWSRPRCGWASTPSCASFAR
jgi:hypothetical protein